jgi:hypothetical protein
MFTNPLPKLQHNPSQNHGEWLPLFWFKTRDNGGNFAQLICAFPYSVLYCRLRINYEERVTSDTALVFNPLTSELNPSAQRCLTRFLLGFASCTVHFVNICVKIQQMQQLFIQFINYVWLLRRVSALHCHLQGAFVVLSERCSR